MVIITWFVVNAHALIIVATSITKLIHMETLTKSSESILFSQTFLKAWALQLKRLTSLIDELDDAALAKQTAPGRNTGIYLVGHMVAVHDGIYPLLGFGQRL